MSIQSVKSTNVLRNAAVQAAATGKSAEAKASESTNSSTSKVDTFVKDQETEAVETYTPPKKLNADDLKVIQEQQVTSFKNMLSSMLKTQGNKAQKNKGSSLSTDMFTKLSGSTVNSADAASSVSENGAWGVKAVATRIMDMAVALSGGDPAKISTLRKAVDQGFSEAGKAWGGTMPSITGDTHAEINKRFDYWEKNGSLDGYSMS